MLPVFLMRNNKDISGPERSNLAVFTVEGGLDSKFPYSKQVSSFCYRNMPLAFKKIYIQWIDMDIYKNECQTPSRHASFFTQSSMRA